MTEMAAYTDRDTTHRRGSLAFTRSRGWLPRRCAGSSGEASSEAGRGARFSFPTSFSAARKARDHVAMLCCAVHLRLAEDIAALLYDAPGMPSSSSPTLTPCS